MDVQDNINNILRRIEAACLRAGRKPCDITVIAVTKTVDVDRAKEALECGMNNLGENKVQEFMRKYELMDNSSIKWHMIGNLQKNKVKYIIDKVEMIHSVESIELAEEINKKALQHNLTAKVLIELNIGEEESKFGINADNVYDFIKSLEVYSNINIQGLMTVAPPSENPEDVRWVFKKMKNIYDKVSNMNLKNVDMKYLSMGMTSDFEIAIEEGSIIVRIGTAIFGARVYH